MPSLSTPLRVVFYREEDCWVAHCLEFSLIGHGDTKAAALEMLAEAIAVQLAASAQSGNWDNLLDPAPAEYVAMYTAGRDVADGSLRLAAPDPLSYTDVGYREFASAE